MAKGIVTAVGTLLIVILILYLAYIFTKQVGKGIGLKTRSRNMKVVDQIMLGRDRTALIVQVGGRLFLVGSTASQISLISELGEDDVAPLLDLDEGQRLQPDFKEILDKFTNRKKKNG